jgi:aspartyl-tRNA(Asn)/glutamyl-tRNA(Gln) amidotransferase subunit A
VDGYGAEFAQLLANAETTSAVDYLRALRARHLLQRDFELVFDRVDAIIVPAGICTAPRQDHLVATIGIKEYRLIDVVTRPTSIFNLTGVPSVTMPAGFDHNGLPIGIQVAARPFNEAVVLQIAHAFQRVTDFHTRRPSILERLDKGASTLRRTGPAVLEKPVVTHMKDRLW